MNSFDKAFNEIIGIEGGYVYGPDDRGGETKYGISKRSYPNLDIKNLTLNEARNIYYRDFWKTPHMNLDKFPYKIALELFDTGVNMGMPTARRILQEALNVLNRNQKLFKDLRVDGWIGDKTLKAVSKVKTKELLKTLNGLQFIKYYQIAENNKSQEKFFGGWVMRT